jgi:hypothetical protein
MPALTNDEQRELLRLLRKLEQRSAATFDDISGDGRLREAVIATRALVGASGDEITDVASAGREARAFFKTLLQGALVDGLRAPIPGSPDRGVLREPFKALLREVLAEAAPSGDPSISPPDVDPGFPGLGPGDGPVRDPGLPDLDPVDGNPIVPTD